MKDEMFMFKKNALSGAISDPLCAEYNKDWRVCGEDKEKLVGLCMRQQAIPYFATYCHQGKGLSKDYILQEFGEYINGYTLHDVEGVEGFTYGLYVDYDYDNDLLVDKDVIHIMHTVGSSIVVSRCKCPTIYVSNRSKVHLVGEGFNTIRVYLFDESEVTIEDIDEESRVTIYKYSKDCKVNEGKFCIGKVDEFQKELRL